MSVRAEDESWCLLQCVSYPRKTRLRSKKISVSQTLAQTTPPPAGPRITASVDSSYQELQRMKTRTLPTEPQPSCPFPNSSPTKPQAPTATVCSLHFDRETVALQLFWLKNTILGSVLFRLLFSVCFITGLSYSPEAGLERPIFLLQCPECKDEGMYKHIWPPLRIRSLDSVNFYQLSETLMVFFYNFWKLVFF